MLSLQFYQAGYCKHLECVMTGQINLAGLKNAKIPMVVTLIKHPKHGLILFDVGYSENFFSASQKFPERLYRMVTPVVLEKTLAEQFRHDNIDPFSIKYIFISHFHADHISALDDFPNATIITSKIAYDKTKKMAGFSAVRKGILPDLIKLFQGRRIEFIEDKKGKNKIAPFFSYDLFGDGDLLAVSLPGHAVGQYGLFLQDTNRGKIFLIADATWMMKPLIENRLPLPIVRLVNDDHSAYVKTFHHLHQVYHHMPNLTMVPCHCAETFQRLKN